MTKNNSTNWARFNNNRYEGEIKQQFADIVEMKKAEWNKKGITFKQLSK